ncbi:MAG: LysM peptidoglycan-binding domain-containing protein [Anaerolineae bacterium]|nr:LysM peptidoglycan-binding domain-containing protein [Anaerolineae bacterium]
MERRESRTIYAAGVVIIIAFVGIFFFLWYLSVDNQKTRVEAAPTTAVLAIVPTEMGTAVLPTIAPDNTATLPPVPQTHTIQSGQTLFAIANSYHLTVDELAAANNITDPALIQAGQELIIPNQFTEPTPPTNTQTEQAANPPTPATSNPSPTTLNGIPLDQIVIMPPNVLENTRAIYAKGQELGRNPHAFSKMGDSTVENDHFLSRFDGGPYNLGDYTYLQRVIDYFPGSFNRDSAAVRIGLHSWTVFDPIWADKTICQPNETVIACEIRLHNPSILFIRLGSNDVGAPDLYGESMRQIVQFALDNGVIPIIGTKADRSEGSNQNNDIVRQISADYQIPLWEFDPVAGTLPGRGLDVDNIHMNTFYAHDYTDPTAFTRGHAMHNLTALMMLDAILNEVIEKN